MNERQLELESHVLLGAFCGQMEAFLIRATLYGGRLELSAHDLELIAALIARFNSLTRERTEQMRERMDGIIANLDATVQKVEGHA